jgi:hypothetical protein
VKIRRAALAVATYVAAIVVALAVPVSELRTISITTTCCCPDPTRCHCPDHKPDHSKQPSIRACHRTQHEAVAPQLPSFSPPEVALAIAPPRIVHVAIAAPLAPHAAPSPEEPYGPS